MNRLFDITSAPIRVMWSKALCISISGDWYGVDLNMDKNDFPFDSAT